MKIDRITVTIGIDSDALAAAVASLKAFAEIAQRGFRGGEPGFEFSEIDAGDLVAFRTDKLTVCPYPSDRYLGLVAAVAAREIDGCAVGIEYRHGWPILSVVTRSPTTVAEGEGAANALPGGPAA